MLINQNSQYYNRKSIAVKKGYPTDILLAAAVGCTRQTIAKSMRGESTRFDHKIATVLEVEKMEFWPERYAVRVVDGEDDKGKIDSCNTPPAHL